MTIRSIIFLFLFFSCLENYSCKDMKIVFKRKFFVWKFDFFVQRI